MRAIDHQQKAVCQLGVCREITAQTIGRIRNQLTAQLASRREAEIDLSMVREVDTAGIEGILALRNEALRRDVTVRFVSRNKAFLSLLEQMDRAFH